MYLLPTLPGVSAVLRCARQSPRVELPVAIALVGHPREQVAKDTVAVFICVTVLCNMCSVGERELFWPTHFCMLNWVGGGGSKVMRTAGTWTRACLGRPPATL
jgi:hypothetical protein